MAKEKENKEKVFELYPPSNNRDLRTLYPELKESSHFAKLNKMELFFVYYYASYHKEEKDKQKRLQKAMYSTWGNRIDNKTKEEYESGNFPEKVRIAIDKWNDFDLPARMNANMAITKAYDNVVKVMSEDMVGAFDFNDKKAYLQTLQNATELLPKLLELKEKSFGIKEVESKTVKMEKALESWHADKKG
jgi:hypothetical protein